MDRTTCNCGTLEACHCAYQYTLPAGDSASTEPLGEAIRDAFVVRDEEATDRTRAKRRAPPMSTYLPGRKSYPTRPRREPKVR